MRKVRIEKLESGMILAKSIYSADGRILVREQTTLSDGLIGKLKDMGLPARDVFDSLITEKVYRHAYSSKKALYHIVSRVGTEFDPEMARAFVAIIEK
jgi:hypothetical protein